MNGKMAAGVAATATAAVVAGLFATSGTASAAASLDLNYSCTFPLIDVQPVKVHINAAIPDTITVGVPTGEFTIEALSTLNEDTTTGLKLVKVATIEGTAVSTAHITAPGFDTDLEVPVTVEKTAIPASGGFTVKATGKTPSLKFPQAGPIKITVHDLMLNITARKADGSLASIPPSNPFDAPCAQDPGQNNVLKEGEILPGGGGGTTTPTTPSSTTQPTTEPTTTEPTSSTQPTTEPTTTEPTSSTQPTTEPTTTEPTSSTQPTTEPTTTEPTSSTQPTTEPTTTEPTSSTQPTTEPTTTEPTSSTQPTTEPTTTQPTSSTQPTTKPTTTAPTSSTQPTTTATTSSTQPTTQPPTTEPTTTEPTTTTVTTLPVVNTQIPSGGVGGYVPTSNNSNGELANTGVSLAWPLGIGLLLIALGANALLVMRLRARRR